jgi:hypothetical protein
MKSPGRGRRSRNRHARQRDVISAPSKRLGPLAIDYLQGFVAREVEKWAIPIKAAGAQID